MAMDRFMSNPAVGDPSVYTDLSGLQKIRQMGKGDDGDRDQALKAVAQQFESVFLNMMMKSMRDANAVFEEGSLMNDSNEMQHYQQMFDQQLALSLSSGGRGVGIAEAMMRQLQQAQPTAEQKATNSAEAALDISRYLPAGLQDLIRPSQSKPELKPELKQELKPESAAQNSEKAPEPLLQSQADFKERLWPLAEKAGAQLGVDPSVILAQAALETGWGKHMITRADGGNSHNLFGIKANNGWQGDTAVVSTLEYRDGIPQREQASFRAYDSYADSFRDYVDFIRNQGRYSEALKSAADSDGYLNALQQAGYATDPAYADKIRGIAERNFGSFGNFSANESGDVMTRTHRG